MTSSGPDDRQQRSTTTRWLETQRGQRSWRAAPRADRAIAKIMRPLAKQFGAGGTGLSQFWDEIAGPKFAPISKPLRFQGGRDGRTLVISAPGPAAALITASGSTIIDRANGYLGAGYVSRIKVIQTRIKPAQLTGSQLHKSTDLTPEQKTALKSSLENIEDDALRQALEKLGRQVYSQSKS